MYFAVLPVMVHAQKVHMESINMGAVQINVFIVVLLAQVHVQRVHMVNTKNKNRKVLISEISKIVEEKS